MFNTETGNAIMIHGPKDVEDLENLIFSISPNPK
jgi:hypothetical protein